VVGEQRTHLDADVAPDALLEPVLHRLHAPARERAGRQVLDALDGAELGTLAAREAEVHVHERHLARPLLLLADLVGERRVRNAFLLQATFDDVDGGHTNLRRWVARACGASYRAPVWADPPPVGSPTKP